jgi:hypothetical protein
MRIDRQTQMKLKCLFSLFMPTRLRSAVDCDSSRVAPDMWRLASLRTLHVKSTYKHAYFSSDGAKQY